MGDRAGGGPVLREVSFTAYPGQLIALVAYLQRIGVANPPAVAQSANTNSAAQAVASHVVNNAQLAYTPEIVLRRTSVRARKSCCAGINSASIL